MYPPMPNLTGDEEDTRAATIMRSSLNNESRPQNPHELSVMTKTSSQTHHVNWAIDNKSLRIARLAGKGDKRGVIEACVEKNTHEFKLELCASGWRNSQDGYSAFYLTVKDEGESFVARYRVNVGDITRISSIRHDFHLGVGFPNFCEQSALDALVANDNLNFVVTIEVFNCQSQVVPTRGSGIALERLHYLSTLLENIHSNRLHTDVVLVCKGYRIPAHKAFLASASPVFRAMFKQPFLENSSSEVSMDQFLPQTVASMVRFLYTARLECATLETTSAKEEEMDGLCSDLEEENSSKWINTRQDRARSTASGSVGATTAMLSGFQMEVDGKDDEVTKQNETLMTKSTNDPHIFNLFQFAEMYKMTSLVIACCQKMRSMICVDNTCELLIRLNRYSHVPEIEKIQESIWHYVKENYRQIKKTSGFARMVEHHPGVVAQLMDKLL